MPGEDGIALRSHLEERWRLTGERPAELDGPALPEAAVVVWEWFLELASARRQSGFGPSPLVMADIEAFFRLRGTRPVPWELAALRVLDAAYMRAVAARAEAARRANANTAD